MARKPSKGNIKRAADRAEARSAGEKTTPEATAIDPPETTAKVGRPTEYRPEFVDVVRTLCEAGAVDDEIAEEFGVSTRTINRWRHKYPEFRRSAIVGKAASDDRVEFSVYKMSTGYYVKEQQAVKVKTGRHTEEVRIVEVERFVPPQHQAASFWLKNRRQQAWRDVHKHEVGAPGDFSSLSDAEINEMIAAEADLVKDVAKNLRGSGKTKH